MRDQATGETSVDATEAEPAAMPSGGALPASFDGVRVALGAAELSDTHATLDVTETSITWGELRVAHADVIMHAVAEPTAEMPSLIFAQLESEAGELRIVPDDDATLQRIFEALCAGAALAEDALAAEEGRPPAGEDEPMYTRMPDGRVGVVDFDAMLDTSAVDGDCRRFEDAEEGDANGEASRPADGEASRGSTGAATGEADGGATKDGT